MEAEKEEKGVCTMAASKLIMREEQDDQDEYEEIDDQSEPLPLFSRDQILGAEDNVIEPINIPEWGCRAYIRTMRGWERDRWDLAFTRSKTADSKFNIRAKFAVIVLSNEKGERIFTDSDVQELGKKSAAALDRIFMAGMKLNMVSESDVEELEKNY